MAVRALKGLEEIIPVISVEPKWGPLDATENQTEATIDESTPIAARNILLAEAHTFGWIFSKSENESFPGSGVDTFNNTKTVRQLYRTAEPNYTGKNSVPVLWDLKTKTVVNNEVFSSFFFVVETRNSGTETFFLFLSALVS